MGNLENSKLDRQTATNQYKDLMNSYNHLYTQISLKENQIITIENFVEKYLPMKILNQMQQIINHVWDKEGCEERVKMEQYETLQKKEFIQVILCDEGIPDLAKALKELKEATINQIFPGMASNSNKNSISEESAQESSDELGS